MDEVDGTSGVAHVLEHMLFKGTRDAQARRVLAPRRRAGRARERLHHARLHRLLPADPGRQAGRGDEAGGRPLRQQPVARRGVQARTRGGQGRAAPAHRGLAARAAVGSAERHRLPGLALPPPRRRLDERPGRDDAAGRARLLPALVRARQRRGGGGRRRRSRAGAARWPRSTTAACPPGRCRARKPRDRAAAGRHRAASSSRRPPTRPTWRWRSRCRSSPRSNPARTTTMPSRSRCWPRCSMATAARAWTAR